jgi:SNF2 family DNA or RNA helicase
MSSDYYWYVSGTAFINPTSYNDARNFIGVKFLNEPLLDTSKKYIQDQIMKKVLIRHTKDQVSKQIKIPSYSEEVLWTDFTDIEKRIYDSKKSRVSKEILQQLCCHILIANNMDKYFGKKELNLDEIKDKLYNYHARNLVVYQKKIAELDPEDKGYHIVKSNYSNIVSEAKYMMEILKKLDTEELEEEEEGCSICVGPLEKPALTPCGHVFCYECLELCLESKNKCPLCNKQIKNSEIYIKGHKIKENIINPLIQKYGSKLGKLISLVRKIISNENHRIIIFSQWDKMLALIAKTLANNGVPNNFVKGNVWCRNNALKKFKEGKESRTIMLSLSNSASGTNLTEATHIIFVEPINATSEEVESIEAQAIARACRLGQKNKIKVIRILTKNTIEEDIYNSIYKNKCKVNREEVNIDNVMEI